MSPLFSFVCTRIEILFFAGASVPPLQIYSLKLKGAKLKDIVSGKQHLHKGIFNL